MDAARACLERLGLPGRDLGALPTSAKHLATPAIATTRERVRRAAIGLALLDRYAASS